jgi:hypothetical protein
MGPGVRGSHCSWPPGVRRCLCWGLSLLSAAKYCWRMAELSPPFNMPHVPQVLQALELEGVLTPCSAGLQHLRVFSSNFCSHGNEILYLIAYESLCMCGGDGDMPE